MTYQDIKRADRFDGTAILYIADEVNHVQFISHVTAIRDDEPFPHDCYECGEVHDWRRVWVKVKA